MPRLHRVAITFNTHGDDKDHDTVLHVFVKNRRSDTSTPEGATDYIANLLSFERHEAAGTAEINPYLACAINLAPGATFDDPSSHTFDIPLRSSPIPLEEVVLPVVNIHILPNGNDTWIFDYTVTFVFDDGKIISSSSNRDGITGIILDQDNRNHSGICVENPFVAPEPLSKPQTDVVLQQVCLEFYTHEDDANKDNDTQLNIHIVNRLSASASQDIVVANNVLPGQEFAEKSTKRAVFPSPSPVRLADMMLPQVFINIAPNGNDRWRFDYQVCFTFSNGRTYTSRSNGIVLDQDRHKYAGVYQGSPFPTVTPPGKPQANVADHRTFTKSISLSYLQKRFDEFINNRQGVNGQEPAIQTLYLHNTGSFNGTLPESYYDLQSLVADPPPPGALVPPGTEMPTRYDSHPTSLGQLTGTAGIGDLYLNNIKTQALAFSVNPGQPNPLSVKVDFDCSGPQETVGGVGGMNFTSFSVQVDLSLAFDPAQHRIDVLSWVPGINDDDQIGNFIHVHVVTTKTSDPGGIFQKKMRGKIFDQLKSADPFTGKTLRDRVNEAVNSWLVGGVLAVPSGDPCVPISGDGCVVSGAAINGDNLNITYTRTGRVFVPAAPADWPQPGKPSTAHDFSPGKLANIDHIVVLTMENRSFDSMLGYLSLPPERGGMGRTDVDGLKGGEFNKLANGQVCPSFAFPHLDTVMNPDPPHGYEPVHLAINGGKMDGFAQSYADERGLAVAPRIMGYHTAANLPVYDVLARDFALGHRWFASHPGPTFCNRFYELTGMLNIEPNGFWEFDNSSPLRPVFTPTIFDHLTERGVSWRYFEHHYCFLRFFQKYTFDSDHLGAFDDPIWGFAHLANSNALPSVSFIDPHYVELPPGATCDGPPADVQAGQRFVQKVVETLISSPSWEKTLLIITYDEHGGFYDHVPPPAAVKVSPDSNLPETYGVRVPVFLVSPWVTAGSVFGHDSSVIHTGGPGGGGGGGGTQEVSAGGGNPQADSGGEGPEGVAQIVPSLYFDHTSILKTIARRFMSDNPPYMGARYAAANDLSPVINGQPRPSQFRPFIPYNLVYVASQKRLDVQGANTAPGTLLWQWDPNESEAQQFSFEDAGGGFFYIRTHTGSLYLTADDTLGVKQDVKYPAGGTGAHSPDRQRWELTSNDISILHKSGYSIRNGHFLGKVLQPANGSNNAGTPVVLGDPQTTSHGVFQTPNPWQVTSPLLGSGGIVAHP